MALQCRTQLRTQRPLVSRASRRTVQPVAFIDVNKVVKDITRIFSPDSMIVPKAPTDAWRLDPAGFSGDLPKKNRKPFKDGYVNNSEQAKAAASAESTEENAAGYMSDAIKSVMNRQFTSDHPPPEGIHTGYSGDIPRKGKKPFPDNYANTSAAAKAAASQEEVQEPNAMGYVSDAVKGVVAKNFPSDKEREEPSMGFSGDIHYKGKKGFHSKFH